MQVPPQPSADRSLHAPENITSSLFQPPPLPPSRLAFTALSLFQRLSHALPITVVRATSAPLRLLLPTT